jgi:hypothetical protein
MLDSGISTHLPRIDALEVTVRDVVVPRVEDIERKVEFLMRKVG